MFSELLPPSGWLLMALPPPKFPFALADEAFPPEDVVGTELSVAAARFAPLQDLGYQAMGTHAETIAGPGDVDVDVGVVAFSSSVASVWVVFFNHMLAVLVLEEPTSGAKHLVEHLAARKEQPIAWGSFPVGAQHVPAAARAFNAAVGQVLDGGTPKWDDLRRVLTSVGPSLQHGLGARHAVATAHSLATIGDHRAAVRALAYYEDSLANAELAFLEEERRAAASAPPILERGQRTDQQWVSYRAAHINESHARLREAFAQNDTSTVARAEWQTAARRFHDAVDTFYEDVEKAIAQAKQDRPEAVDYLITFLEADPWCFRSGYVKGRMYEVLRRARLENEAIARVSEALLRAVDAGYRREFRSACRLAQVVAGSDLMDALRQRLHARDGHLRRRALWMLTYLPGGLDDQRLAIIDVLIDAAGDAEWWRVARWVRRLCSLVHGLGFEATVKSLAFSTESDAARRGLRLLPSALVAPLGTAERAAVEHVIVEAVHDRGPAVGVMEGLAAVADTEHLRSVLASLAQSVESPTNMHARWALSAAIRANREGDHES